MSRSKAGNSTISVDLLLEYPLFRDMSHTQVAAAANHIEKLGYESGTNIFKEGEQGDDVFILLEGEISITQRLTLFTSRDEKQERDKSLIHLNASMRPVIGEIALCANTPRSASVTARSDVVIGGFSADDLKLVIDQDPHFGYLFYRNLSSIISQRLITANENVLKLTTAFSLALQRKV
ncbi:cyclic nucleotide-binding domain-containing protein [bacterium]|nr:cyclic nucleotide-binding domain-containing protein [bacterium]